MGLSFSNICLKEDPNSGLRSCLAILMRGLTPEELLPHVVEDSRIYEICRDDKHLRKAYIWAAQGKYNEEKEFDETVRNRTASYVVILDNYLQYENQESWRWCSRGALLGRFFKT